MKLNNNFKEYASSIQLEPSKPKNRFDTLFKSNLFDQNLAGEILYFMPVSSAISTIKANPNNFLYIETKGNKKSYNEK